MVGFYLVDNAFWRVLRLVVGLTLVDKGFWRVLRLVVCFTFVDNALGTLGGRPRVLGATGCSVSESVSLELSSVFEWTA